MQSEMSYYQHKDDSPEFYLWLTFLCFLCFPVKSPGPKSPTPNDETPAKKVAMSRAKKAVNEKAGNASCYGDQICYFCSIANVTEFFIRDIL